MADLDTSSIRNFDDQSVVIESDDENDTYEDSVAAGDFVDGECDIPIDYIISHRLSANIRALSDCLRPHLTEKGSKTTNVIDSLARKNYCIPSADIPQFFINLEKVRLEGKLSHFLERQETQSVINSGIMLDFDMKQLSPVSLLTNECIEIVVSKICTAIRNSISMDGETFHIFIIKKQNVSVCSDIALPADKDGLAQVCYKDGFHVLIPELLVPKNFKRYLCGDIINRGGLLDAFKKLPFLAVEGQSSPSDYLDKNSAHVPVHFLGNCKVGSKPYLLSMAFEIRIDDDGVSKSALSVDILNGGRRCGVNNTIGEPINLCYELSLGFNLSHIDGVSTWLKKRALPILPHILNLISTHDANTSTHGDIEDHIDNLEARDSLDMLKITNAGARFIHSLLCILDISYAVDYRKWFNVLRAVSSVSPDFKILAKDFSMRCPEKFNERIFNQKWEEALGLSKRAGNEDASPISKRSLMAWAKASSPEKFKELLNFNHQAILSRAVYSNEGRVEHSHVAQIMYSMIGDKFVADAPSSSGKVADYCWYEFVVPGQDMRHGEIYKWRKEASPDNMHIFISDKIPNVYKEEFASLNERRLRAANKEEANYYANIEKTLRSYRSRLANDSFQHGVVRQALYRFRQRGFMEELDSYTDILGVGNGILKLGPEPQLIQGFHEYKISKYTDTDYIPYDPENPCVKILMKGFADIFPEPDVCEYMLFHACTGLDLKESACILLMLVGGGQNGKTFFAKMVHNTLGNQYCASGKPSLLTAKSETSESANSALMQMKDKRYFYFDEFNKCEVLNMARVKSIVSPGWQTCRDLYQKQENFKNTCNPIALSNFDFIVNTTEHGTWRRLLLYRNKVTFKPNPNPDNPFDKKIDYKFMDEYTKSQKFKEAMLSIMVHYYSRLCKEFQGNLANVVSPTILRESAAFRNDQDLMNKFIIGFLVVSPNSEPISLSLLSARYIEWMEKSVKQQNVGGQIEVQSQFENSRIGKHLSHRGAIGKILIGFRLKLYAEELPLEGETPLSVHDDY